MTSRPSVFHIGECRDTIKQLVSLFREEVGKRNGGGVHRKGVALISALMQYVKQLQDFRGKSAEQKMFFNELNGFVREYLVRLRDDMFSEGIPNLTLFESEAVREFDELADGMWDYVKDW